MARIVVVALDEGIDVLLEVLERSERGAGQRLTLQDREPAFDLVEPRRPRGCVVEGYERMTCEPFLVLLVRVQIVEDNFEAFPRVGGDDIVHECQELLASPTLD